MIKAKVIKEFAIQVRPARPNFFSQSFSLLLLIVIACIGCGNVFSSEDITEGKRAGAIKTNEKKLTTVRYYKGYHDNGYDVALLNLILTETEKEFGPWEVIFDGEDFGTLRVRRELEKGHLLNVYLVPLRSEWPGSNELIENDAILTVMHPMKKGLLGYRALVIHKDDKARFAKVKTLKDLRQVQLGQVKSWFDSEVYRYNEVPIVATKEYVFLYAMLNRRRYDALPLGVGEIDAAMEIFAKDYPDLIRYDNLILHYSWPVVYQVSAHEPIIAERIKRGLDLLQKNGKFDALFEQYYGPVLNRYNKKGVTLIELDSPYKDTLGISLPKLFQRKPASKKPH